MYLREVGGRRSVVVYRTSEMFKRAHLEADEETKGEDSGDEISGENDQGEVLEGEKKHPRSPTVYLLLAKSNIAV